MFPVVFAHGMESSPGGTKATYLGEQLGAVTPDLSTLGLADQVAELARALERLGPPGVVVGSSLGGLTALGLAARHPALLARLVLLAPAVNVRIPPDRAREIDARRPGLVAEMARFSELSIPPAIPTVVIHGLADDVVETARVLDLVQRSPAARLLLVHDDHPLTNSRELILSVTAASARGDDPLILR